MEKKLTRPRQGREIAGVCIGLAKYFNIDVTLVRVVYACLSLFSAAFPGLLLYILLAIFIPQESPREFLEDKQNKI